MTAPPGDRGQLDFLQHVQRIFDEGEFVATAQLWVSLKYTVNADQRCLEILGG